MMQQDLEIVLPAHPPVTLIECYLQPGAPLRAIATNSLPFFATEAISPADGLHISLRHPNGQIILKNGYLVDSANSENILVYNYASSQKVSYEEGAEWEMVVHRDDKEIARGVTRFLPKPEISAIDYALSPDSLLSLSVTLKDAPLEKNFYRLTVLQGREWGYNIKSYTAVWTDQQAQGGLLRLHMADDVKVWSNTICVQIDHLEENYYTYLRSIEKAHEANYNPFAQPANIQSGLQGSAIGIFTTVSSSREIVQLEYKD